MTAPRIFQRRVRVTVDNLAITGSDEGGDPRTGLRVGFTIEKDLTLNPNHAELVIYNLSRSMRQRLARADKVPVVVEAGYAGTSIFVIFAGHMREAFSRAEADGTWATILRAGDGDKALRTSRRATSKRPGVSFERVVSETFAELKVGAGNLWSELKGQLKGNDLNVQRLTEAFGKGFNGAGAAAQQMIKQLESAGYGFSVQDGEVQVLAAGQVLSRSATLLSPHTGLEGSPEVDAKGVVSVRARIIPGLTPGFPVELDPNYHPTTVHLTGEGFYSLDIVDDPRPVLYRIERTRYVGDTHGTDWNAELTLREPKDIASDAKRAEKKAEAGTPESNVDEGDD